MDKRCRTCRWNIGGQCQADWFTISVEGMVDPIKLIEEGILDSAINETVESLPFKELFDEISYEFSELNINVSKKKTDEFKKMFTEYLTEEFQPKIKRKINTSMERLLDAHCEIPENSLEINDEYEFSCAAYM